MPLWLINGNFSLQLRIFIFSNNCYQPNMFFCDNLNSAEYLKNVKLHIYKFSILTWYFTRYIFYLVKFIFLLFIIYWRLFRQKEYYPETIQRKFMYTAYILGDDGDHELCKVSRTMQGIMNYERDHELCRV